MKESLLAISAITLLSIFTFSCAKEEPEPVNKTVAVTSVSMNTSSFQDRMLLGIRLLLHL